MYKIFGDKGFRLDIWEMTQKYYPELAKDNICFITNMDREYSGGEINGKKCNNKEIKEYKIKIIKEYGRRIDTIDWAELNGASSFYSVGRPVLEGFKLFIDEKRVKVTEVVVREDLTAWTSGVNPVAQDSLIPVFAKYK